MPSITVHQILLGVQAPTSMAGLALAASACPKQDPCALDSQTLLDEVNNADPAQAEAYEVYKKNKARVPGPI